jgi:hypothetical protein
MFRRIALAAAALIALAAPLTVSGHVGAAVWVPNIVPSVTCVVHNGKANSYWFGYTSDGPTSWDVPVGTGNALLVNGGAANRGQTTQFLSGRHEAVFVVTALATGTTVTWTVSAAATRTATTSSSVPTCPAGYNVPSATPQSVGGERVNYSVSSTSDSTGKLLTTNWSFSPSGVYSVCSAGGTPLTPTYVYGYNDDPLSFGAQWMVAGYAKNLNPLAGSGILGTVTDSAGRTFTRTSQSTRAVTNVQLAQTATGVLSGSVTNRGLAFSTVIIDAYARCQFGTTIVTSHDPIWVDQGAGLKFNTVTTTGTGTSGTSDIVQIFGPFAKDGGSGGGGSYHR